MSIKHAPLHPVVALDAISRSQLLTERTQSHGHLVIHVIIEFKDEVNLRDLRDAFVRSFVDSNEESRFHYVIEHGFWTRVDHLDLDFHFLDCTGEVNKSVNAVIDELVNQGMGFHHPPWQLVLVNSKTCIFRFHHALGDGATMMQQLLGYGASSGTSVRDGAANPFTFWEKVKAAGRLLTVFPDPAGILRLTRRPTNLKTMNFFCNLKHSVQELKMGAKQLHVTINDLLTCALSLSLTRTLSLSRDVLATIWVALPEEAGRANGSTWGNERLGVTYVKLSREYDLIRSLRVTSERLERVKKSPEPFVVNWALRSLSLLQKLPFLKRILFPFFTDKASVSISNLKGPEDAISWPANFAHVEQVHILTPPIMRMGLMVNFLSYNGRFSLGLCGEDSVLSQLELQRIAAALDVALHDLLNL